jgi:hypothetical protein
VSLDIYVMFDRSGSMQTQPSTTSPTRLAMVRNAMTAFLEDPESDGIGLGIGYFGNNDLEQLEYCSCDPADYATPDVPIGVLPTHADALIASLESVSPLSETPTGAAIRGACSYTQGWKQEQGSHAVVIMLVTDGEPKAPWTSDQTEQGSEQYCNPTLADAEAAAAECLGGMPAIRTYVLGVGSSLESLNQIAAAGGTETAYLVENESSAEILEALNAIRGAATVPCELRVPEAPAEELLDYYQVNLVYMDAGCEQHTVYNVEDRASCDPETGGWYYDPPGGHDKIVLCEATCEQVAVPGAQLYYSIGCRTFVE